MTYPPPPGTGDEGQLPPDPAYAPIQPYQPTGYPQSGYQPYAYQYPYPYPYAYPQYAPVRPTDGLAIASLVVSCMSGLGLCAYGVGGLLGIVGAILGHVARRRIRVSGANGDGLALAGVIVGWVAAAIGVLAVAGIVLLFTLSANSDYNTT
jgi:hypothetical protein